MNGLHLMDMAPSDMLDVIHVLFEADYIEITPGQHEIRERVRKIIYSDLYGMSYSGYAKSDMPKNSGSAGSAGGGGSRTATKPYIPPTAPEDLPRVLGAPLG